MTNNLWTWGGIYFGYRDGNDLWTHDGKHVGRFNGDKVYNPDGRYLGETRNGKLITQISAKSRRIGSFSPHTSRIGKIPYIDQIGTVMYAGYEDFPRPDSFR